MYVPTHFKMSAEQAREFVSSRLAGDLVTVGDNGLEATFLPYSVEWTATGCVLKAHVARVNKQWQHEGQALVIFNGPDLYVPPRWTPQEQSERDLLRRPQVVPTWNYVTVHMRGNLVAHHDEEWITQSLRELVSQHDASWDISSIGSEKLSKMTRALVGLEIRIDEIIGKAKMSQNRSSRDISNLADAIAEAGHSEETQNYLREISLPHALAREELVVDAQDRNQP